MKFTGRSLQRLLKTTKGCPTNEFQITTEITTEITVDYY